MVDLTFTSMDRTWIIAEIGVNHEGDVGLAEDMVRLAAEAGARCREVRNVHNRQLHLDEPARTESQDRPV